MSKRTIILIALGALLIAAAFVSLIIELKPKGEDIQEEVIDEVQEEVIEDPPPVIKPLKVSKDNNVKVTPANESGTDTSKET